MNISASDLFVNSDDKKQFSEILRKNGECRNCELQMNKKDGSLIWGSISAKARFDQNKKIKSLDCVLEDISERKNSEFLLRQLNATFERFVPRQFLNRIAREGIENIHLGRAEDEIITILFADIRSFTKLSETMDSQEVLDFLNSFLKKMSVPVHSNHGFVDKFIGDEIMALFDSPEGREAEAVQNGVKAAIEMTEALQDYNQSRQKAGYAPISIGIGIHSGPVTIGTVGSEYRMDSTVLGDSVNIASRLEKLNRYYHSDIIVSSHVHRLLKEASPLDKSLIWRELGFIRLKGKDKPISIFEILNSNPEKIQEKKQKILNKYHEALRKFYSKKWDDAIILFQECLNIYPEDVVSKMYIEQSHKYKEYPLSTEWDGSLQLENKYSIVG
jgi:adenylate cyclase